jgi:hypothetical protein
MRKQSVGVKTRKEAKKLMPWACVIIKVQDGYMGFESIADAEIWKKQK